MKRGMRELVLERRLAFNAGGVIGKPTHRKELRRSASRAGDRSDLPRGEVVPRSSGGGLGVARAVMRSCVHGATGGVKGRYVGGAGRGVGSAAGEEALKGAEDRLVLGRRSAASADAASTPAATRHVGLVAVGVIAVVLVMVRLGLLVLVVLRSARVLAPGDDRAHRAPVQGRFNLYMLRQISL
jgi:hypothetical protein